MRSYYRTSLIAVIPIAIVQLGFGFVCSSGGFTYSVCLTQLSQSFGVDLSFVRAYIMDPGHNDCLEPENQKCCKGITPYGNDSFNRLAGIMTVDLFHGLDCRNMDPLEQCPDDVDFGNRWNKRMEGPGVEIPQDQKYNPSCFRTAEGKDNLAANVNNASPNTLAGISSDNIGESQIVDFNFNIAALTDGENDIQDNRFADAFSSNFDRS